MTEAAEKTRVLFVCMGNCCRSPTAEALLKHLLKERGLEDKFFVDSCGTSACHVGDPPNEKAVACLATHSISTDHIGRQLCADDFTKFDYMFGFDAGHMSSIAEVTPEGATAKIDIFASFDPTGLPEFPDPYYGGPAEFEDMFQQCLRCCNAFLDSIVPKKSQ